MLTVLCLWIVLLPFKVKFLMIDKRGRNLSSAKKKQRKITIKFPQLIFSSGKNNIGIIRTTHPFWGGGDVPSHTVLKEPRVLSKWILANQTSPRWSEPGVLGVTQATMRVLRVSRATAAMLCGVQMGDHEVPETWPKLVAYKPLHHHPSPTPIKKISLGNICNHS